MQRRTRTRHQRKPYSTTRRVHRRRGFSKRYNRAKHTRYKKRRRRKTRRGRQRRGGAGVPINSEDVCKYVAVDNSFDFSQLDAFGEKKHNCNVFRYKDRDSWYMYRNPNWAENGKLKCSKTSAMTKTPKVCPNQKKAAAEAKAAEEKAKAAAAAPAQQDKAKEWARRARQGDWRVRDLVREMIQIKNILKHTTDPIKTKPVKEQLTKYQFNYLLDYYNHDEKLYNELDSMDMNTLKSLK
jgi:hypothetical protein